MFLRDISPSVGTIHQMHASVSSPTASSRGQGESVLNWVVLGILLELFSPDFRPYRPGVSPRDYDQDTLLLLGQYS